MAHKFQVKGGGRTGEELMAERSQLGLQIPLDEYRALRQRVTFEELQGALNHRGVSVTVQSVTVRGGDPQKVAATVGALAAQGVVPRPLAGNGELVGAAKEPPARRFPEIDRLVPAGIDPRHVEAILLQYLQLGQTRAFINGRPVNDGRVYRWARNHLGRYFRDDAYEQARAWLTAPQVRLLQTVSGSGRKSRETGRTLMLQRVHVGPVGQKLLYLISPSTGTREVG